MRVKVRHRIDRLAAKYERAAAEAPAAFQRIVHDNAKDGRDIAKTFARESAGDHGKLYHRAITLGRAETSGFEPVFASPGLAWEFGPEADRPQGGMSFEWGSRNQKPHLDLNRAADVVGPEMGRDVVRLAARLLR
ncbi:MAG TPA: hypothetical protein VFK41_03065 [Nocardioidaceae bacterium]|nr:hypothetical protein [Nocardioidaceae bacterium]